MLVLSLYPAEFITLIAFLSRINREQLNVPVTSQPLAITVLLAYQEKLSMGRIFAWQQRNTKRAYRFQLPVPVAKAFHQEMQATLLTPLQQALLHQFDLALINYRSPQQQNNISLEFIN